MFEAVRLEWHKDQAKDRKDRTDSKGPDGRFTSGGNISTSGVGKSRDLAGAAVGVSGKSGGWCQKFLTTAEWWRLFRETELPT